MGLLTESQEVSSHMYGNWATQFCPSEYEYREDHPLTIKLISHYMFREKLMAFRWKSDSSSKRHKAKRKRTRALNGFYCQKFCFLISTIFKTKLKNFLKKYLFFSRYFVDWFFFLLKSNFSTSWHELKSNLLDMCCDRPRIKLECSFWGRQVVKPSPPWFPSTSSTSLYYPLPLRLLRMERIGEYVT